MEQEALPVQEVGQAPFSIRCRLVIVRFKGQLGDVTEVIVLLLSSGRPWSP